MNITRLNFSQTLPLITKILKQSHLIAIDLQMSGINTSQSNQSSIIDSMQKRYQKTKYNINKFIPLQLGICGFKIIPQQNKIISYPFNFYIYPLLCGDSVGQQYLFHIGSLKFLSQNNFDFNKLFYEGIPYISKSKIDQYKKQNNQKQLKKQLLKLNKIISPDMIVFSTINIPKISLFLSNQQQNKIQISIKHIKVKAYQYLIDCIYQKYPSLSLNISYDYKQYHLRTKMILQKRYQSKQSQSQIQTVQIIKQSQLLINQVIEQISQLKKPILVHNGYLDLMHIYYRFHQNLPSTWQQYSKKLKRLFPCIYDTKYIATSSPFIFGTLNKITNLQNVFYKLQQNIKQQTLKPITIQIDNNFNQYSFNKINSHQAGYDALMTGSAFIRQYQILKKPINQLILPYFYQQDNIFKNRLPLGNVKIPLNLDSSNDIYSQDGNQKISFKKITNKSQQITQSQIFQHFNKNYGPINIIWEYSSGINQHFHLSFLDKNHQLKFKQKNIDQDGIALCIKYYNHRQNQQDKIFNKNM